MFYFKLTRNFLWQIVTKGKASTLGPPHPPLLFPVFMGPGVLGSADSGGPGWRDRLHIVLWIPLGQEVNTALWTGRNASSPQEDQTKAVGQHKTCRTYVCPLNVCVCVCMCVCTCVRVCIWLRADRSLPSTFVSARFLHVCQSLPQLLLSLSLSLCTSILFFPLYTFPKQNRRHSWVQMIKSKSFCGFTGIKILFFPTNLLSMDCPGPHCLANWGRFVILYRDSSIRGAN